MKRSVNQIIKNHIAGLGMQVNSINEESNIVSFQDKNGFVREMRYSCAAVNAYLDASINIVISDSVLLGRSLAA